MGSMREGRKSIIFVSEGLHRHAAAADAAAERPESDRSRAGCGRRRRRRTARSSRRHEWFGQAILDSAPARGVPRRRTATTPSIYSLDPRGLAPFEYDIDDVLAGPPISFQTDRRALQMTQDTLRTLSEETDGRAIVNRNTLEQGLAQIVRDSSFYYLLGYNSTQAQNDGKFHEIKVRVKRSRRRRPRAQGLLGADRGRRQARRRRQRRTSPSRCMTALASIAPSVQAGKYVRTWIGTERGDERQDARHARLGAAAAAAGQRTPRTGGPRLAACGECRPVELVLSAAPTPEHRTRAGLPRRSGRRSGSSFDARAGQARAAHDGAGRQRRRDARPGDRRRIDVPDLTRRRRRSARRVCSAPARLAIPDAGRGCRRLRRLPAASSRARSGC